MVDTNDIHYQYSDLCIYILMIVKIQFYHLYTNLNQRFLVTLEDNIVLLKLWYKFKVYSLNLKDKS